MSSAQPPFARKAEPTLLPPAPIAAAAHPPARRALAVAILAVAQSLIVLDVTVLNVAAPRLVVDLHLSPFDPRAGYYALFVGAVPPVAQRLGEAYGRRRLFMLGMGLFTVASLVAGLADSAQTFQIAQSAQGAGGALATAGAVALMTDFSSGAPALRRASGVYFAAAGIAATLGVLAGAVLVDWLSWRWALLANVPVGAAAVLLAALAMPETRRGPVTPNAVAAVCGSVGLLLLGRAIAGFGSGGWSDGGAIIKLVLAVVLLAAFNDGWAERAPQAPTPASTPASASTSSGQGRIAVHAMLFLLAAALFGMLFLLTIFMQALAGYSVLRTGLALLPIAIAELIACAVGPRLMARFGLRAAGFAAAAAAAIGLAWLARSTPASGYAPGLLVPMALAALGCGIILLPVSLPRPERGAEPAILPFTSRQIGLTLGSAAVISAVSASFRGRVPSSGPGSRDVLDNAFLDAIHVGFATAALLAATAAIIALAIPRRAVPPD